MVSQYPYGLSSLYLLPFFQPQHTHTHTRTQTNPCHATPAISTANRMCMAIAAHHPLALQLILHMQQYTVVG